MNDTVDIKAGDPWRFVNAQGVARRYVVEGVYQGIQRSIHLTCLDPPSPARKGYVGGICPDAQREGPARFLEGGTGEARVTPGWLREQPGDSVAGWLPGPAEDE